MNRQLKENKQTLRQFMRDHYTDDRLTQLLDHARSGGLKFYSCCCFIGIATADHDLQTRHLGVSQKHYFSAKHLHGAPRAEQAYRMLGHFDNVRIRKIIPMILAEIQRRQRLQPTPVILPDREAVTR